MTIHLRFKTSKQTVEVQRGKNQRNRMMQQPCKKKLIAMLIWMSKSFKKGLKEVNEIFKTLNARSL